jgi:hypothetical protein
MPGNFALVRQDFLIDGIGDGRAEVLRRFVAHTPPPVAAKTLGCTDFTTEQAATDIGATWSRYAAGERR